jgi:hypothetical protein
MVGEFSDDRSAQIKSLTRRKGLLHSARWSRTSLAAKTSK